MALFRVWVTCWRFFFPLLTFRSFARTTMAGKNILPLCFVIAFEKERKEEKNLMSNHNWGWAATTKALRFNCNWLQKAQRQLSIQKQQWSHYLGGFNSFIAVLSFIAMGIIIITGNQSIYYCWAQLSVCMFVELLIRFSLRARTSSDS